MAGDREKKDKAGSRNRDGNNKRNPARIASVIMCSLGLVLLGYLVVSDWISEYKAAQVISYMDSSYDPLDDPELVAVREDAERYNARMSGEPYDGAAGISDYEQQLLFRGLDEIAWVSIPKLDLAQPVYHGTSEGVLMKGIGHLENSSLPVGGPSSHSVLTGHSGMSGNRMFDDIRRLEVGDVFVVHTLGMPYAYKVYGIDTVWPHERDSLAIVPGEDRCTLVTCTPLGVNDHRLLVHGERVDYDPSMEPSELPYVPMFNLRTAPFIIALVAVALFAAVSVAVAVIRRRRKDDDDDDGSDGAHPAEAADGEDASILPTEGEDGEDTRAEGEDTAGGPKLKAKPKRGRGAVVGLALVIAGMTLLASAVLMDWYETYRSSIVIDGMTDASYKLTDEEKEEQLVQADAYNAYLRGAELESVPDLWPYSQQLSYDDEHIMSYIDIPKTATKLPIRHGTAPETLMTSAGHLEGTSLPVGGAGTHCVISAHSGMAVTRMFDDIYKLEPGDKIILWTLGEPHAYEVTDSETVTPDDSTSLKIQSGEDLLTLVTCTPYMVNTHRLLVHAKRCGYSPDYEEVPAGAYINYRTIPFLIGAALGIPAIIGFAAGARRRNKKRKRLVSASTETGQKADFLAHMGRRCMLR